MTPPSNPAEAKTGYRPPDLARRWRVSADKVLRFIATGELRAVNLSTHLSGRPRWWISAEAVSEFESRRAATPVRQTPRRRRQPEEVIQYF